MVWDGMRQDYVGADLTPNLWSLAQRGVRFQNHHAVYLSSTEVNGTALATGVLPRRSGIVGNREYRPALNDRRIIDMQDLEYVEKGDAQTKGRFIALPTVAAQVQAAGLRSVVASTKGVGVLQDRPGGRRGDTSPPSIDLFTQAKSDQLTLQSVPAAAATSIQSALGALPAAITFPNEAQDEWIANAVLDGMWKSGVPAYTMIWLSEPDFTQHQHGLGSEQALAAMRSSDRNLGRVMAALRARGELDTTDILVVSDHGFSTIERAVSVSAELRNAGFDAVRDFNQPPKPGQVLVIGNGGSVFLYVIGRDPDVTRRVVEFLQTTDFTGPIFMRSPVAGTLALGEAFLDSVDAPDVAFSMNWSRATNARGVAGMEFSDGSRPRGAGMHASLSPFDMHNTLVAAGPDFREGVMSTLPSGNLDVAPTVMHLLGIAPAEPMDGRVLWEALRRNRPDSEPAQPVTNRVETGRDVETFRWSQYLQTTHYDGVTYLDEGGATSEKKQAPKD